MNVLAPVVPVGELLVDGMPARAVKALTTTCERALTLRSDGYVFTPTDRTGIYECQKPPKIDKVTGEILQEFAPYIVDVQAQNCTCEGFLYNGHCKHERAIRSAVIDALELLLPPSSKGGSK